MTITFWRQEAETVNGVLYLPRDERASDLCKLLGKAYIRGEASMDQIYNLMDKLGVGLEFYEAAISYPACTSQRG